MRHSRRACTPTGDSSGDSSGLRSDATSRWYATRAESHAPRAAQASAMPPQAHTREWPMRIERDQAPVQLDLCSGIPTAYRDRRLAKARLIQSVDPDDFQGDAIAQRPREMPAGREQQAAVRAFIPQSGQRLQRERRLGRVVTYAGVEQVVPHGHQLRVQSPRCAAMPPARRHWYTRSAAPNGASSSAYFHQADQSSGNRPVMMRIRASVLVPRATSRHPCPVR